MGETAGKNMELDEERNVNVNGNKNGNGNKNENENNNKSRKQQSARKSLRRGLLFLQHLLLASAAVSLFVTLISSIVVIDGESFMLNALETDSRTEYEESELFHTLYGQAAADIIRLCAIRTQLETDGEFDGKKIIDVTAYNNRNDGNMTEPYVTARYYLEDLLKWGNYGLEYTDMSMTQEQLLSFFSPYTIYTAPGEGYTGAADGGSEYILKDSVSANMLYQNDADNGNDGYKINGSYTDATTAGEAYYDAETEETPETEETLFVLQNRYKTVDGKNIEDYVSDCDGYLELRDEVVTAMSSLYSNYEEYIDFMEKYDVQNTNLRYFVEISGTDKAVERFTNMEGLTGADGFGVSDNAEAFLVEKLGQGGRYFYYSPSEMTYYDTNSRISESTVNSIVRKYDYAYSGDVRIFIGVDASYAKDDALSQGRRGYQNYLPYSWNGILITIGALILYLVLLIFLTCGAGKESDKEGKVYINLTKFDNTATELFLVILICLAGLLMAVPYFLMDLVSHYGGSFYNLYYENTVIFNIFVGVAVFCVDIVAAFFYYSLVRRIKAGVLWKNSCLRRFINWFIKRCRALAGEIYSNSNIVIRVWAPYALFLLFNMLMIFFGCESGNGVIIVIALIIDLFAGVIFYNDTKERRDILAGVERITQGDFAYKIEKEKLHGDNIELAEAVNSIGSGIKNAVEISMKDERMKTELITNVSHDIKTPLTSIINYVDLLKREEIDNERVRGYIKVLDEKSQRLKQLIDDLVEASKISSGNISLNFERINLSELLNQSLAEFSDKFEQKSLSVVMDGNAQNVVIEADSRSIWRVIENLFNNIYKYALERTRVYITLNLLTQENEPPQGRVELIIKNISENKLNCNPGELTERFIRGDEARTTEGSGLGLSIAKSLTEAQHGTFEIALDGDLFKVILTFPLMREE